MRYIKDIVSPIEYEIRKKKDAVFNPLIRLVDKTGVSPDIVTLISISFGILAALSLIRSKYLFLLFIVLHVITDNLDGGLARYRNSKTSMGKWLDYLGDMCVVISVMGSCAILADQYKLLFTILPILVMFVTFLNVITKEVYFVIHINLIYYLLLMFNIYLATGVALGTMVLDLIIVCMGVVIDYSKERVNAKSKVVKATGQKK